MIDQMDYDTVEQLSTHLKETKLYEMTLKRVV